MTLPGTKGEVSPESIWKTASSAVGSHPRRETGPSPHYWGHCGPKSSKPCKGKPFDLSNELELESQKGNPAYVNSRQNRFVAGGGISLGLKTKLGLRVCKPNCFGARLSQDIKQRSQLKLKNDQNHPVLPNCRAICLLCYRTMGKSGCILWC